MKLKVIQTFLLSAFLIFIAGCSSDESAGNESEPSKQSELEEGAEEVTKLSIKRDEQGRAMIKVATLSGTEQNQLFQQNFSVVSQQREEVMRAKEALDQETDEEKKIELQETYDRLYAQLLESNEFLKRSYGISIDGNYLYSIEKSRIFIELTEEEADKIAAQKVAETEALVN